MVLWVCPRYYKTVAALWLWVAASDLESGKTKASIHCPLHWLDILLSSFPTIKRQRAFWINYSSPPAKTHPTPKQPTQQFPIELKIEQRERGGRHLEQEKPSAGRAFTVYHISPPFFYKPMLPLPLLSLIVLSLKLWEQAQGGKKSFVPTC